MANRSEAYAITLLITSGGITATAQIAIVDDTTGEIVGYDHAETSDPAITDPAYAAGSALLPALETTYGLPLTLRAKPAAQPPAQ